MVVGKPNIDPAILNPRHRYGTSISTEPPEDVVRKPQGRECVSCGHSECGGHPK